MNAIDGYFESLRQMQERVLHSQRPAMERAAERIAACLRGGGRVYTFGTGHGHLLALEIFYRAGGMAAVYPVLDERLMLHKSAAGSTDWERKAGLAAELLETCPMRRGDVLLAISNSGRNAAPVELALGARERGVFVIALTSLAHSRTVTPRNPEGLRLFEAADLVLDNGGVLGDAVWQAEDGGRVGPTSTAMGAAILQAIVCRVKELSLAEGWKADFFLSSNVDGGDAVNGALLERYGDIPGLR